ncbi:hypothetical protein [Actinoplanes sp. NPDC023714]|uniref:hypothetical protein n=1 Tax=Actinoplanes sp. NPDC023714 TaxID=3154322 RepID=UPI0034082574
MALTTVAFDRCVREGDLGGLTALLLDADEPARRSLLERLSERLRDPLVAPGPVPVAFHALAVIAGAPSAARAAALLGRRELRQWHTIPAGRFLAIARARGLPWAGDLGVRLAGRIRAGELLLPAEWDFVVALLDEGEAEPPVTEGVVLAWLRAAHQGRPSTLAKRLRASRFLDPLLPAVFTIDGLGARIPAAGWDGATWDPVPALPAAIARLTAEGRLDRAVVLAATVDRLVRGDRPAALRPFALLHDILAPVADEVAEHASSYATLLASGPSPIAGLAQRTLRGAGVVVPPPDVSAEALARPEKTLVKAQLTWLGQLCRRDPAQIPAVLEAVEVAAGSPVLDIRERARALLSRYRPGTTFDAAPPAAAAPSEVVRPPAAMPEGVRSAAELAEEVVAVLREPAGVRWERIMAAVVALPADGLAEALGPVLDRHERFGAPWGRVPALGAAIRARAGLPVDPVVRERLLGAVQRSWTGTDRSLIDTPADVLTLRIAELAVQVGRSPLPELLATPTDVTGSVDAGVLADRMARLEAEGREPWPLDYQQALLRVPRGPVPERAGQLTSPHGRRLARWLTGGGLPDPITTRFEQRRAGAAFRRVVVNVESARTDGDRLLLEDALVTVTRSPHPDLKGLQTYRPDVLAMVLPHHREVTAAWALPDIAALADQDARDASLLPMLADRTGPIGPAVILAVAYGLGARHAADRIAAVDAFLPLAACAPAVGAALGDLCSDGTVKPSRVAGALTEAFHAGGGTAVWQVIEAALPALLVAGPRGLPDLLELGTRVAGDLGVRVAIPELAVVAGRAGGSRLLREARRLEAAIGVRAT